MYFFCITENVYGRITSDPHFIPLVSKAQAYITSKSNQYHGPGQYSSSQQGPSSPQQQHGQQQYPEEGSRLHIPSNAMLGKDTHTQEDGENDYHPPPRHVHHYHAQSEPAGYHLPPLPPQQNHQHLQQAHPEGNEYHPPQHLQRQSEPRQLSRKVRQAGYSGDNRKYTQQSIPNHLSWTQGQQVKSHPVSSFKFSPSFKEFEKSLTAHKNDNLNSFSMPFRPSSNTMNSFPNFGGNSNGNSNPFGSTSLVNNPFHFGSPNGNIFNFQQQQHSQSSRGNQNQQNNLARRKNNNNNYHNNYNFNNNNQFGNGLFPELSQQTFQDKLNKDFEKFDNEFTRMFSRQRQSNSGFGNFGGGSFWQGNNQIYVPPNVAPPPPPKQNPRPPNYGYHPQNNGFPRNNYSPRQQQYPANNYGVNNNNFGFQNNNYNSGRPNINTNYGPRQIPSYGVGGFPRSAGGLFSRGRARRGGGYNKASPRPLTLHAARTLGETSANLAHNSPGIDGISDLYDWLGSDEPLLKQFTNM